VSGGVEVWHAMLAQLGVTVDSFTWEDGVHFAKPSFLTVAWRDGATTVWLETPWRPRAGEVRVGSVPVLVWNFVCVVTDERIREHPSAQWITLPGAATPRLAVIRFKGRGTWILSDDGCAFAIFTNTARELRTVVCRTRQLVAGEGLAAPTVNTSLSYSACIRFTLPEHVESLRLAGPDLQLPRFGR
jgi:hypothetical protein